MGFIVPSVTSPPEDGKPVIELAGLLPVRVRNEKPNHHEGNESDDQIPFTCRLSKDLPHGAFLQVTAQERSEIPKNIRSKEFSPVNYIIGVARLPMSKEKTSTSLSPACHGEVFRMETLRQILVVTGVKIC